MFKLKIDLLPKGAWNNDFSKTLPQKEWDKIREICYKKANYRCQICGCKTNDLDAHEVWIFDAKKTTQTLKDIIAICTKCHGVIHFKNTVRLGYGLEAKKHFIYVNKCTEMDFAKHLSEAIINYEELNKVYRWKMIADLSKFGGTNEAIKNIDMPYIINPYDAVKWHELNYDQIKEMFIIKKFDNNLKCTPQIASIQVDNYQGKIIIDSLFADRVEWYINDEKYETKYNIIGRFITTFSVINQDNSKLWFKLSNENGYIISKPFKLKKISV